MYLPYPAEFRLCFQPTGICARPCQRLLKRSSFWSSYSGQNREFGRDIQNSVPVVGLVLVDVRSNNHLWQAVPDVDFIAIIIETHEPIIRPWAKREHGEAIGKLV